MFTHLQVRSAYSFLSGPRRVEELVARAAELGYRALALTDIDNLCGAHAFIEAATSAGLRPIVGADLHVAGGRLLALVENSEGFGNLCELISAIRDHSRGVAADAGLIAAKSSGLVFASYDPPLLAALMDIRTPGTELAREGALYAALSPLRLGAIDCARRLGLPLLALGDAAFLEREDREVHRVLRAIAFNTTIGGLDPTLLDPADSILFGPADAERLFASWPEALRATEEVAERCRFSRIFEGFVFPAWTPEGNADDGAESSYDRLRRLVFTGAEARWNELPDAVVDRLEYELDIIKRKGFTDYFLVVAEIAGFTSRICGRGSGAASAVAYSLGITNVDPLRHHLWFERFLNEARPDPPDIDLDFAWDERDDIIRRAIERFGAERAARVANHLTFRPRSALREAAKAWGMPDGEIAACARDLLERGNRAEWEAKPLWGEILRMAHAIENLPRGLSMHCGGLVITPGPIIRFAPVERSAEGYPLLQWDKEGTEAAGLVKIDLLGNRSLAVIRDALANLAEEGIAVTGDGGDGAPSGDGAGQPMTAAGAEFERIALADKATQEMLATGDTMGVFYIESPAMRQLQKKARVGDYDHIVIHSSIIRPAANKFITQYVKRLHGLEPTVPLHPRLTRVLDETLGIMVYQEDVSKAAIALAGFDESQADGLRKILAKKNRAAKLAEYQASFFAGCGRNGVDKETADRVWEMMESFAGYSFCKPHSASYAVVSFQSAWLRRHHPAEFMAAVLSNGGGFYTALAYVSEARRMGIPVVGPDVSESRCRYHASGGHLVVGLMAIGGLSRRTCELIVAERERGGVFADLGDFARRLIRCRVVRDDAGPVAGPEEGDLIALVEAGAFDGLAAGLARPEQARFLLGAKGASRPGRTDEGTFAFGDETNPERVFPKAAQGTARRQAASGTGELEAEFAVLGFLRDRHPLDLWRRRVDAVDRVLAAELATRMGRRAAIVCLPVTSKEVETRTGDEMAFVSFEDESAIVEAVLFPETYERYSQLLYDLRPLVVEGRVEDDLGALSFEVERISPLCDAPLSHRMASAMTRRGLGMTPGCGWPRGQGREDGDGRYG